MDTLKEECNISDQDLREALKEMGAYVDVTEEDLKKIYSIALQACKGKTRAKDPGEGCHDEKGRYREKEFGYS